MARSSTSHLVRREPCPSCRKKGSDRRGDNLAVYSDGHKYCFACKYKEQGNMSFVPTVVLPPARRILMPFDVTTDIPALPAIWLSRYEISLDEVKANQMHWSPSREMLIFPFFGENELLEGWQGRFFGENSNTPKYHTVGFRDKIFAYQSVEMAQYGGVVVVEDVVSSIRVGRMAGSLALLGSTLPSVKVENFRWISNRLFFWLDYDKRREAMAMSQTCKARGYDARVIITKKDPKEYGDDEILNILDDVDYWEGAE